MSDALACAGIGAQLSCAADILHGAQHWDTLLTVDELRALREAEAAVAAVQDCLGSRAFANLAKETRPAAKGQP
jgi:hypothetical protein